MNHPIGALCWHFGAPPPDDWRERYTEDLEILSKRKGGENMGEGIKLNSRVKDCYSSVEGIVIGLAEYSYDTPRALVLSAGSTPGGEPIENWITMGRLQLIDSDTNEPVT